MVFSVVYFSLAIVSGLLLFVGWIKYRKTDLKDSEKKKSPQFGYGAGYMIASCLHIPITDLQLQRKRLFQIATKRELEKQIRDERIRIYGLLVWLVFFCAVLGVAYCVMQEASASTIMLERDSYDGSDISYDINVALAQGTTEQVTISVHPMEYTEEEIESFFEEGFEQAWIKVLGKNESFLQIDEQLDLVETIEGNPITLSWWWEDSDCLLDDGNVNASYVGEGKDTVLFVEAKYMNDVRQQSQQIHVCSPVKSKYELIVQKIVDQILDYEQMNLTSKEVEIPSDIEGGHLTMVSSEANPEIFFIIIIGLFVFMYLKKKQDFEEAIKDRQVDLIRTYPNLIQKLLLYLGAGMTLKQCFEQIYAEHKDQDIQQEGYVYKEIGAMVQELKSGVSEVNSYEAWGKQLQMPCYLKLVTILTQNLSKGNQDLLRILKQEMLQALRERQEFAKKQGEEASTKLLFPMLILLMVTIVIVVVPAFVNFSL